MSGDNPPSHFDRPSSSRGVVGLVRDIASLDRRTLAILFTVPVVLTLLEYYGLPWHYTRFTERRPRIAVDRDSSLVGLLGGITLPGPADLRRYLWWGLACLVLLVVVPSLVAASARVSPRELGLRLRGTGRDAWTYLALYAVFFPVIWLVSQRADFRQTYPFYKPFPEAMGAIGAGLVLGVLAWRTGTIIYGWFLHYAVALSMDLLALEQAGRLSF